VRSREGKELWAAPVEGRAFEQQAPAFDQGVVYATSPASVVALRTTDGSQIWRTSQSVTPGSATAAPQVANGSVFAAFTSTLATVYALDVRDGAIRWKHTLAPADTASLTVADGVVYVAFGGAPTPQSTTIVALRASDGAVRWRYTLNGDATTLAVTDGALVLRSIQFGLIALDAASGGWLWQRGDLGWNGDLRATQFPIIANDVIYLAGVIFDGQSGIVLAMNARTGGERWRTVLDQYADVYVSLAGQTLYVGGSYAYALRASDGHVVWRYGSRSRFYQPVVSEAVGEVFIGSSDPGFHLFGIGGGDFLNALDARTGALYWRTPGVADNTLLVSS
jgi:outer membrane protein assembly factor BamB